MQSRRLLTKAELFAKTSHLQQKLRAHTAVQLLFGSNKLCEERGTEKCQKESKKEAGLELGRSSREEQDESHS